MPTGTADPIGTVRIRTKQRRGEHVYRCRMIKVRMDGPISGRWIHYAHWWWEQNRGPVPHDKRVLHVDGDTLNDDPANYAIGTCADAAAIWHDANPAKSRRNYERCRAAARIHNRLRGEINRSTSFLPWSWYAVDLDQRIIHQGPVRKRWMIYVRHGMEERFARSRFAEALSLGWFDVGRPAACLLSVLADGEWLDADQLAARAGHFARRRNWPFFNARCSIHNVIPRIAGRLIVRPGRRRLYHIASAARRERSQVLAVTPIRGRDLLDDRFAGFERSGFGRSEPLQEVGVPA